MLTRKQIRLLKALNFSDTVEFALSTAGLGVTAGGALLGAGLSQLKYNADKKKLERMGLDISDLSRAKYALAGGALGGAAGFGAQHLLKEDADKFVDRARQIGKDNNEENLLVGMNDGSGATLASYNKDKDDIEGKYHRNIFGVRDGKKYKVKDLFKDGKMSVLN